jgi:hypothetical protein
MKCDKADVNGNDVPVLTRHNEDVWNSGDITPRVYGQIRVFSCFTSQEKATLYLWNRRLGGAQYRRFGVAKYI